jgi:hypothetical protein
MFRSESKAIKLILLKCGAHITLSLLGCLLEKSSTRNYQSNASPDAPSAEPEKPRRSQQTYQQDTTQKRNSPMRKGMNNLRGAYQRAYSNNQRTHKAFQLPKEKLPCRTDNHILAIMRQQKEHERDTAQNPTLKGPSALILTGQPLQLRKQDGQAQ